MSGTRTRSKRTPQRRQPTRQQVHAVSAEGTETTEEWIRVADLKPLYFRATTPTKVKAIMDGFDPDAFGVLYVSRRADGTSAIIDGCNRHEAVNKMGWTDQRVPCHVYHGLTTEREAALFVQYNEKRTKPRPVDIFLAKITANDPDAAVINRILKARDLHVSNAQGLGTVMAVQALQTIHKMAGQRILGEVLDTCASAWGKKHTSFQSEIITALAVIKVRYPRIDLNRMAKKLAPHDPSGLITKGRLLKQTETGSIGGAAHKAESYVARIMIGLYNSGLRVESKLSWQERTGTAYWMEDRGHQA